MEGMISGDVLLQDSCGYNAGSGGVCGTIGVVPSVSKRWHKDMV